MSVSESFDPQGIAPGWREFYDSEQKKSYFGELTRFLIREQEAGKILAPSPPHVLRALCDMAPCDVRVVILGQDPYHGAGQAIGRSFAVHPEQKLPPSLRNIWKELQSDLGFRGTLDPSLEGWAAQGVLLLNAVLTVELDKPMSHRGRGWEEFTSQIVRYLNATCEALVFVLWGSAAAAHLPHIDRTKHLVLTSAHPSPLSAHRGFFGSRPFSKANAFLRTHYRTEIDWSDTGPRTTQSFGDAGAGGRH